MQPSSFGLPCPSRMRREPAGTGRGTRGRLHGPRVPLDASSTRGSVRAPAGAPRPGECLLASSVLLVPQQMSSFIGAAGGPSPHTGDLYGFFSFFLNSPPTAPLLSHFAPV